MSNGEPILIRHGQSEWNASNQFTGWVDVALTDKGRVEVVRTGELLVEAGLKLQVFYASLLRRAVDIAHIALDTADLLWIPVIRGWCLNERHYDALQGLNKTETKEKCGEDQFMSRRRSYDAPPPELSDDSEFSQANDPRYANLDEVSHTECLLNVVKRFIPHFEEEILPRLKAGEAVMAVARGNSLRVLVKHLDNILDEDIAVPNIPTGIPLAYDFDAEGKALNSGGTCPDPEAVAVGIAAVAAQSSR